MKKSAILLLLALFVCCAPALGSRVNAAPVEPTDSGAPSAIVIFPVDGKNINAEGSMPPVVFNHYVHERWMSKSGKDCIVCHHTGDAMACTNCHTVEGRKTGGGVTLQTAMHAEKIAQRPGNTPSSCVSCHTAQTRERRECAGCHTQLVRNSHDNSWCGVCHAPIPGMTQAQLQAGISNKLPARENEKLAVGAEKNRKGADYWSPLAGPYKVDIDSLAAGGKYMPAKFNHRQHVAVLMERIGDCELASAFHTVPATACVTCHHNSPVAAVPPRCVSCHEKGFDMDDAGCPRLMAAFHLQCMNCHSDMKVARPRNTDCENCHKPRPAETSANQGGGI